MGLGLGWVFTWSCAGLGWSTPTKRAQIPMPKRGREKFPHPKTVAISDWPQSTVGSKRGGFGVVPKHLDG